MDMLNIKIVKNLRKKGGKVISFYGLLKIFYNIIYVIYWFLKKFLFVSFLYDKWDNLENKMYIVNKCVLVMIGWGIVYDVEGVFYNSWKFLLGIYEFNICDFLNLRFVIDKILMKW